MSPTAVGLGLGQLPLFDTFGEPHIILVAIKSNMFYIVLSHHKVPQKIYQWEFQDPKMKVLYHMFGHIFWGYSLTYALYRPYIW